MQYLVPVIGITSRISCASGHRHPYPADGIPIYDTARLAQSPFEGATLAQLLCRFQLARWASVPLPFYMDREAESYHGDLIE